MLGYTSLTLVVHFTVITYLLSTVLFMIFFIPCFHISIVICTYYLCMCIIHSFYLLIRLLSDDPEFVHPGIENVLFC